MSDNLNMPAGAAPPKPAEVSKVQPKKETVRISLPPKPTAKETVRLELPPKPAAKETVRLELPPRPAPGAPAMAPAPALGASAAPKPNLPQSGPTISLVVPQVDDASKTVKIPNPAEMVTLQHTPAPARPAGPPKPTMPAKPGAAKAEAPAVMPSDGADAVTMAPVAQTAAPTVASKASVVLPAASREKGAVKEKKEAAVAVPGKASKWDIALAIIAFLAAAAALGNLVRHIGF